MYRDTASAHLPGQRWGADLAVGKGQAFACLLGTSSPQICPFPNLREDREGAQRPQSVVPANPHLTWCLVTCPLLSSPFKPLVAQMSHLAFFLTRFWFSFQIFLRTFLWCHKNTCSITNKINHVGLLTQLFCRRHSTSTDLSGSWGCSVHCKIQP